MTRGLVFGKFAPLHNGHVNLITKAATMVDELDVVLCYDDKFQHTLSEYMRNKLSLRNRHLWLLETFKDIQNINIYYIDESNINSFPEDYILFTTKIIDATGKSNMEYTHVFTSEHNYSYYIANSFHIAKHVVIDSTRTEVPISATMIRQNIYDNWEYIPKAVQKDFVKRVAVIGVESTGKTTLVKNLSNYFNTVYVPEVGRIICEEETFSMEKYWVERDYINTAIRHKSAELATIKEANKIMFVDTNNLITYLSFMWNSNNKFSPILWEMSKKEIEDYDLVIILDIDVPWVADNLRTNGNIERRKTTHKQVISACKEICVNYEIINGSWEERFTKAIKLTKDLLK